MIVVANPRYKRVSYHNHQTAGDFLERGRPGEFQHSGEWGKSRKQRLRGRGTTGLAPMNVPVCGLQHVRRYIHGRGCAGRRSAAGSGVRDG
jgi:hypothetical protein